MPQKRNNRLIRINDEIQKEIAQIIRGEIKDPRVCAMAVVNRVQTTQDLKICKVYVSVYGNSEQKAEVMEGINSANGFIRKLLAERINLRVTPQLFFILDESTEYAAEMYKKIDDVMKQIKDTEVIAEARETEE